MEEPTPDCTALVPYDPREVALPPEPRDQALAAYGQLVRLTPDAMHLEVCIPGAVAAVAPHSVAMLIHDQCADLDVQLTLPIHELEVLLLMCPRDQWFVLYSGTEPLPPVDGTIELPVPIPIATARLRARARRNAVRAGATLARMHPGVPGTPGRDLLGRIVVPRPPRDARLPQGSNTVLADDGASLVAACDGEVLLRNLQIEIVPMYVHEGDLTSESPPLKRPEAVFVTGSVGAQAAIEAGGAIYVQGDVHAAQVWSKGAGVTIMGAIIGSEHGQSLVRAHGDISCGAVSRSRLTAGGSIHLHDVARQCTLRAAGALFLPASVDASLLDVRLHIEGGLFPPHLTASVREDPTGARQHVRVAMRLPAFIAVHAAPPLTFRTCTILNLSVTGARCHVPTYPQGLEAGAIVQLKFVLPDGQDNTLLIARVANVIAGNVLGLEFLQLTQADQDHLTTYCLQLLLKRMQGPADIADVDGWRYAPQSV
jgi:hypothetical protein